MMPKLWGGRFKAGLDESAKLMSYSLDVDCDLVFYDLKVNRAHARALMAKHVLTSEEFKKIEACLTELESEFIHNASGLLGEDEDIHSCVERIVTERLGDLGKKMHTGKSRNDQVVTDVRLYCKDACDAIEGQLMMLMEAIYHMAVKYMGVPFPGFTHLQTAQPVLFSHHLLAYFEMLSRDVDRIKYAHFESDVCPLGSAALAGNNYGLDRDLIASELGFGRITQNSMDAVADRDFMLSLLFANSVIMTHLSRLSEELILWSSPIVNFIEIGDAFTTGSSIMPQKKNPDIAELTRGKSGRVLGALTGLQHIIKGLPLTYNRDLQEDKELLFDSVDTLLITLDCVAKMMPTITLNRKVIDESIKTGYSLATELADYLVKKGVPFREAHEITGRIVLEAMDRQLGMEALPLDELQAVCPLITEDVFEVLTVASAIQAKDVIGGTSHTQVQFQLDHIKEMYGW
jgi:argininosuccinate lyase